MKKLSLFLVLMFTFAVLNISALAESYTASADGQNGPVVVEVDIEDGKITSITVTDQAETPELGGVVVENLPAQIVAQQSIAVDSMSGATVTSEAIKAAVADCLTQAGLDVAAFSTTPEQTVVEKTEADLTTDVLIIGAGGSGLAAAVQASADGAQVLVLEKQDKIGGSTAMSAGGMLGFSEDEDAEAMDLDEVKALFAMYSGESSENFDQEISDDFLSKLNETAQWAIDLGYVHNVNEAYPMFTRPVKDDRNSYGTHVLVQGGEEGFGMFQGTLLTDTMAQAAEANGATIMTGTAATELITDAEGNVTGAKAESADTVYTIEAKSVILATGGWGANLEMSKELWPSANLAWWGTPGDTGDGIVMAKAIGAKVEMESNCLCVSYDVASLGAETGLILNDRGERMADESYSFYELAMYYVRDEKQDSNDMWIVLEQDSPVVPGIKCDTIADVAATIGCDENTVRATFERYNELAGKEDVDFGKDADLMNGITMDGPYYLVENIYWASQTNGGVDVNPTMQVLRDDGSVIGNLYAVGEMSNQTVFGKVYPTCGGSVNYCVYSGRIAGADAAGK